MVSTGLIQVPSKILVTSPETGFLLKIPPHYVLNLNHPLASTWYWVLAIYINPLPQTWSDNPKNWMLMLTESSLIIGIRRQFLLIYSVANSPTIPAGIYTCAVGWTSRHIPSKSWHQNLLIWGSRTLMHWIKAVVSVPLLPEYEGLWIVPIGARLIIFWWNYNGWIEPGKVWPRL